MSKSIGFIGFGNMAAAMAQNIKESTVRAYDPVSGNIKPPITAVSSVAELVELSDIIIISVKPQIVDKVLPEIKTALTSDKIVVSIAAGISAKYLSKQLGTDKIVQTMPNTPMLVGAGASALSRLDGVSDAEFADVFDIFAASGVAAEIPAEQMNAIIAVNGSSPAFIWTFAKAFIDYATERGIDPSVATKLFAGTLTGAAKMMTESEDDIETLIKKVCSPGGTTLAGLDAMEQSGFAESVKSACEACENRAKEIGK
jgi:pyrroline-5-carboxylate reductase